VNSGQIILVILSAVIIIGVTCAGFLIWLSFVDDREDEQP